jgi:hypothetical protein
MRLLVFGGWTARAGRGSLRPDRRVSARGLLILLVVLGIAACQPAAQDTPELPTLAVLPSLTPSDAPAEVAIQSAETSSPATATEVVTTAAPVQTDTPGDAPPETPTDTPTRPTVTIEIREEVRFATLTPVPGVVNAPARSTPVIMADVVITERDFQRAVDQAVAAIDSIQLATVDFVPEGIDVQLTALGGVAYVTGQVRVQIQMTGSFATITISDVTVNAAEPSEAYLERVNGDFFGMIIDVFGSLLDERVGANNDLENIILTDEAMQVFLLVPAG